MASAARRWVAAGAAAVVTLGVAACGGAAPAAPASSMTMATAVLPGVVDPDPASAEDGQSVGYISRQLSGTLFGHNGAEENPDTAAAAVPVEPELATGAEASADGLTWTVELREGVLSQWGNPFTSADVEWTIRRALDRNTTTATNLALMNLDTANPITVVDANTVEFHLTQPSPLFKDITSIPSLTMFDSKAVVEKAGPGDPWGYEWLKTNSASFGPYQVGTVELPGRVVLTANPNYWRGPAEIDTVTMVMMAEASTRLQAVLTGEIDYAPSLDASTREQLDASAVAAPYLQTRAGILLYALFVLDNPEVADVRLRQALNLAIDRDAIVATAMRGLGTPATGCLPPSLSPPATPGDVTTTAQLDAARALVEQVPGPRTVTIGFATGYPGGSTIPELLKSTFAEIGVEAVLKPYTSYSTFFADQADGKFGIGMGAMSPYVREASYVFYNLLVSDSAYNLGSFSDPAFDDATDRAWTGLDEATRTAGVTEACEIVTEQTPWAMLGQTTGFVGINKRITPFSSPTAIIYRMRADA